MCRICEHRKNAFENLFSERGALLRMNWSIQVEGAFGVLKSNRKFKRFLMWGKTNISTELFFLLCLALTSVSSFPNCTESENLIFQKKRIEFFGTENRKAEHLLFTDAQLCCTHFCGFAFEFSTFCPVCTVNAAVFNILKGCYFATVSFSLLRFASQTQTIEVYYAYQRRIACLSGGHHRFPLAASGSCLSCETC